MVKTYIAIQCSAEQCTYHIHERNCLAHPRITQIVRDNKCGAELDMSILYSRTGAFSLSLRNLCLCPWGNISSISTTADLMQLLHPVTLLLHLRGCTEHCNSVPTTISLWHCNILWFMILRPLWGKKTNIFWRGKNRLFLLFFKIIIISR